MKSSGTETQALAEETAPAVAERPTTAAAADPSAAVRLSGQQARAHAGSDAGRSRVALVGVPNTGKSLLFHKLTGRFRVCANYPYTTSKLDAADVALGGEPMQLIDTPGIVGLSSSSEDEAPTRELLHDDPPDIVLLCLDAGNLARSLVLATQLADLEIPMVACLNMVDEATNRGIVVDPELLAEELGVPVYPVCAIDGRGVRRLADGVQSARPAHQVPYPRWLQEKLDQMTPVLTRAHRVDQFFDSDHPDLQPGQSIWHMVMEAHHHRARDIAARVTRRTGLEPRRSGWERVERLALHPLGGWVLLLGTMAAVYLLVAKVGVALLADGLERLLVQPIVAQIAAWTGPGLTHDILIGEFGVLSLGVFNALCTVLPILAVFYLIYGFLEDVGYFPLLSTQFDRLLRLIGLTGRAVLPITLGFGCNTVATMATRCLPTARQRLIACFMVALGIPCAVQLGVMIAILSTVPVAALLGLIGIVVTLMALSGTILARLLPRCEQGEFLVELPPLRRPQWSNIMAKTYHRLRDFFLEALPMFVASAVVLLTLSYSGLLDRIRDLFAPVVVQGFGLPRQATDMLLMTLARREVGAVMMKDMVDAGGMDLRQIFVGLLVMTLFVPCMTNTLVLGRVLGWLKTAFVVLTVMAIAIGMGVAVNGLWP